MKKTIVCFGDSNTHGYDASTGGRFDEEHRFPCLLSKYLGEDYHVVEEGLGGRTCVFDDPITEGMSGLSYITPCLMSHEPVDLLILMLGTNDVKDRFGCTPELIQQGLIRLIQKAKATPAFRDNKPNILILTPVPIEREYINSPCAAVMGYACFEKSQALASLYEKAAQMEHCHFMRAGDYAGVNTIDYMHIDEKGHASLAKALAEAVPSFF